MLILLKIKPYHGCLFSILTSLGRTARKSYVSTPPKKQMDMENFISEVEGYKNRLLF